MIVSTDSIFNSAYKFQVLAALSVNLIAVSHGIGLGWTAPMIRMLQSDVSPFEYSITVGEASWIGSMIALGGMSGNLFCGSILDRIGRKKTLLLLGIPHACFWIIVFCATEVHHLYLARYVAGLTGGGAFITVPIYVAEIADNRIRGRLGSMFVLMYNVGIVGGYILTSYLHYQTVACVVITLPFIYTIMLSFYPDTPQHLLKNGRENEAEIAMKFYKNYQGHTKEEFKKFYEEFNEMKQRVVASKEDKGIRIKDFCTPKALRGLGIGFGLMILNQFSGCFAIINYSSSIFEASGSQMDPNLNSIIIGIIQIVGTYAATLMVDKFGRKILLIVSSFGMCVGLAATGAFSFLAHKYDLSHLSWVPLATLSFVIFICSIGIVGVSFVVLVEILPAKIRSIATMMCLIVLSCLSFFVLKIFPIIMAMIGLEGVMWFCSVICALGGFFVVIFVPETKGKSLDGDVDKPVPAPGPVESNADKNKY